MKRCPDCGFRAKDRICPLCGVVMKPDPTIQTHVHRQAGEQCGVSPKEENRSPANRTAVPQKSAPQSDSLGIVRAVIGVLATLAVFGSMLGSCQVIG